MKIVLVIMLAITTAFATSMDFSLAADAPKRTEIDFTRVLEGINGEALKQCVKTDPEDDKKCAKDGLVPFTLSDAAILGLLTLIEEDKNLDPKKKFERDGLARYVYQNAHALLSLEETTLIKDRIGKTGTPVQVGPAWRLLDPSLLSDR
jgi:hypothetical protein